MKKKKRHLQYRFLDERSQSEKATYAVQFQLYATLEKAKLWTW